MGISADEAQISIDTLAEKLQGERVIKINLDNDDQTFKFNFNTNQYEIVE